LKSKLAIVVLPALLLVSALTIYAEQGQSIPEGMKPYTPTRLEWLAVELNATNRTDLNDLEGYTLSFIAMEKENTILIYVGHTQKTNRQAMNIAINNARKIIEIYSKSRGWDSWIKIREKIELLDHTRN
jgi:hypothetical protein